MRNGLHLPYEMRRNIPRLQLPEDVIGVGEELPEPCHVGYQRWRVPLLADADAVGDDVHGARDDEATVLHGRQGLLGLPQGGAHGPIADVDTVIVVVVGGRGPGLVAGVAGLGDDALDGELEGAEEVYGPDVVFAGGGQGGHAEAGVWELVADGLQ